MLEMTAEFEALMTDSSVGFPERGRLTGRCRASPAGSGTCWPCPRAAPSGRTASPSCKVRRGEPGHRGGPQLLAPAENAKRMRHLSDKWMNTSSVLAHLSGSDTNGSVTRQSSMRDYIGFGISFFHMTRSTLGNARSFTPVERSSGQHL
jgi:hypothetical protein